MKVLSYIALSLGLLLTFSTLSYSASAQVNLQATGTRTLLTLDDLPSKIRIGEKVSFTGKLTTSDDTPIEGASIVVYSFTAEPRLAPIASIVTDGNGEYRAEWEADAAIVNKPDNDVTKKIPTQVVSIFAQYDGDDTYAPSKSKKSIVSIQPNSVKAFVNADKKAYGANESALVFIAFLDADNNFIDPDSIKADFAYIETTSTSESLHDSPHTSISDELEKKKVGSYTYVTLPLKAGHNQVIIIPFKAGYNTEPVILSLTVIRTGMGRL